MEGWISLYRKFLNWQWYKDKNTKIVFIHLLLKANYEDKLWKKIVIKRGQLVTTIAELSDELQLTNQQTRSCLDKLKSTNEITIKSTNKYSLITILKYNDFQNTIALYNKQNINQNNKQITNEQQTNQQANQQQHNNINNKQYNNILNNNSMYVDYGSNLKKSVMKICNQYNIPTKINEGEKNDEI